MSRYNLILFGETHGFLDDLAIQEKIIKKVNPEFYVYEMLEDKSLLNESEFKKFLDNPDSRDFSIISLFGELKPAVLLAKKHNLKVIGCDLHNMGRKNKDFLSKNELTNEEKRYEEELLIKREKQQAKVILETLKNTKRTLFVSVGAYHIRKGSTLLNSLGDCLICYPAIKEQPVFGPVDNINKKDISFILNSKINYLRY